MTHKEFKRKVLSLIEELNLNSEYLTDDPDIQAKIDDVTNQRMYEMCRYKKMPRYIAIPATKGQAITFEDISIALGYDVYQLSTITGSYTLRADGTVIRADADGVLEIDCYVYPDRIQNDNYEFELDTDALEVMVYGVAADLLKSDPSTDYGSVYQKAFDERLSRLDPRHNIPGITFKGGVM